MEGVPACNGCRQWCAQAGGRRARWHVRCVLTGRRCALAPRAPQHALPFELNKQVLDTIGESSLGGVLQPNAKQLAGRYKVIQGGQCGVGHIQRNPPNTCHVLVASVPAPAWL